MNRDDNIDMISGVVRDIAAWDLLRNGDYPDEGAIDDWIYEINLTATKQQFMSICKQYWNEYFDPQPTHH